MTKTNRMPAAALALAFLPAVASAEVKTRAVEYLQGDTVLEGYLAYDASAKGKRPGVLVVHEWMGLNDYAKRRARMLAEMGFVAFAADIYGKGIRATNNREAAALAGKFRGDPALLRRRAQAGLATLKSFSQTDADKVAAIGYCFGGTTVLELARSGAGLQAVVSFHGGLGTAHPEDAKNIKAKVLVLTGAADPHAPMADIAAFAKEMHDAKVDWQLNMYGGAVHSFTNPNSGNDPSRGVAYNKEADERSWEAMQTFFAETIGLPRLGPEGLGKLLKGTVVNPTAGKAEGGED